MDAKECREAFEAWAKEEYIDPILSRNMPHGSYSHPTIYAHWLGWEAAWNRRADAQDAARPTPLQSVLNAQADAVEGFADAMIETGVVKHPDFFAFSRAFTKRLRNAAIAGEKKE